MFTNPNLIYHDAFEFCSIPRLFVCLHLRMSSSQQYANVYVKSIFVCPGCIAGVPFDSVRRFRSTLLLRTTCMRRWVIELLAVWRLSTKKKILRNNLLWCICVLFFSSYVCTSASSNVLFTTIWEYIRQINIRMSGVHCGSAVRFGRALPVYPITAHYLYASLL